MIDLALQIKACVPCTVDILLYADDTLLRHEVEKGLQILHCHMVVETESSCKLRQNTNNMHLNSAVFNFGSTVLSYPEQYNCYYIDVIVYIVYCVLDEHMMQHVFIRAHHTPLCSDANFTMHMVLFWCQWFWPSQHKMGHLASRMCHASPIWP